MSRRYGAFDADDRALALLRERGPMTCSRLGELLWGERTNRPGTAPYARAAGRVLARLARAGLVRKEHDGHHTLWRRIK